MRPEMKSTQNEILDHHKRCSVYITLHCRRNEIKFHLVGVPRKTVNSVIANHFCFDEINACADTSSRIILFRIVFTWYFITRNEISVLSKWPQWNNTRVVFHFGLYHVVVIRNWQHTEMKTFYFAWNEISCKHPLN